MSLKPFTPERLPWTVGVSLPTTLTLIFCTGGFIFFPLGLYLGFWLRRQYRRSAAFYTYIALATVFPLYLLPERFFTSTIEEALTGIVPILCLTSALLLRQELIDAYRQHEGYELTLSLFWTTLFGSIYINYCIPPYPPCSPLNENGPPDQSSRPRSL